MVITTNARATTAAALTQGWRPQRLSASWVLPSAALLLPILMLCVGATVAWRNAWKDARTDLFHTADAAAEYATRVLDGHVVAAGRINDFLRGLSDEDIKAREAELHARLAQLVPELPQAEAAYVIDRFGYPLLAASVFPVPRNQPAAADRDFFRALSGANPPAVHVSQIYVGRFDQKPFFAVSRPRVGAANAGVTGPFQGLVNVSVDPVALGTTMRRLVVEPEDTITLRRNDGQVLARTARQDEPAEEVVSDREFSAAAAAGQPSAVYETTSSVDRQSRLMVIRQLDGHGIYATASRPRAAIVGTWRETMASHLLFGVPATIALLLLSLRIRREQLHLMGMNTGLAVALRESEAHLRRAQKAGGVHPFELGPDGVAICDNAFLALYGLPPGTRLDYPTFLSRVHPDDRARIVADHERLGRAGGAFSAEFRVPLADGTVRWILAQGEVVAAGGNFPDRLIGVNLDITALKAAEIALSESEARLRIAQDAGGIGSWDWDTATGRLWWSRRTFELFGFDPEQGEPSHDEVAVRRHPADRLRVEGDLEAAKQTGVLKAEYRVLRPTNSDATDIVWIATQGRLVPGLNGEAYRMLGVHRDITARKQAEERAELLAREVEHRAKNALTIVQAVLRLTRADTQSEFVRLVQSRVAAISRAIGLLAQQPLQGADLQLLLEGELAAFLDGGAETGPRVALSGPPITLSLEATQPVTMAIHELVTNAIKYGALSVPNGVVTITWLRDTGTLHLHWRETGGPPVMSPPARNGFGTRMIESTIERQLRGQLDYQWDKAGLVCKISLPLTEPLSSVVSHDVG